jgi:hypothetical protein
MLKAVQYSIIFVSAIVGSFLGSTVIGGATLGVVVGLVCVWTITGGLRIIEALKPRTSVREQREQLARRFTNPSVG